MEGLRSRKQHLVYLITYSRADKRKVGNREAFASIVQNAFEVLDVARIEHWVVSEEEHEDEGKLSAFPTHFHMAVKLTQRARW